MATWDATVGPIVERHCGACHGEARSSVPVILVDHAALLAGENGMRQVDRMVGRIVDGTMPPIGMPRPPQKEMQAIVDWASCGEETTPRLVWSLRRLSYWPENPPAGLEELELLAQSFPWARMFRTFISVGPLAPVTEDKFIRRMQVVIDESRVLHHLVLLRDTEGTARMASMSASGCRRK